ncbi:MAG: sugar phosphate isomerase/epimerase family protein [Chloroflexota bacterium]
MQLSFLPDEATSNFVEGLTLGVELGLRCAEVRLVDGVNVLDMTDAQIQQAKQQLDDHGMAVSAIATPFFKTALPGQEPSTSGPLHGARVLTYEDHVALLTRGVEIAQAFDAPAMRIFSFWRDSARGHDDVFWESLQMAVDATLEATAGSGVTPCLENEGACFIGTSAELAEVARRIPNTALQFIWDPGNSSYCGMPPRSEDFAIFSKRIGLVHLKDAHYNPETGKADAKLIGSGDTNFHAELQRLASVDYTGRLTFEPHYQPNGDGIVGMRESVNAIRQIADELNISLN